RTGVPACRAARVSYSRDHPRFAAALARALDVEIKKVVRARTLAHHDRRGIPEAVPGRAKKTGILRVAAYVAPVSQPVDLTGWKPVPLKNDRVGIQREPNCHYIRQLSISE